MSAQTPSGPPKLPYESAVTAIINLIQDRPISGVGLLCVLVAVGLLLSSVPLGWPTYVLLN